MLQVLPILKGHSFCMLAAGMSMKLIVNFSTLTKYWLVFWSKFVLWGIYDKKMFICNINYMKSMNSRLDKCLFQGKIAQTLIVTNPKHTYAIIMFNLAAWYLGKFKSLFKNFVQNVLHLPIKFSKKCSKTQNWIINVLVSYILV